jgi:DeoR/GlpR family transcriptional regulator of sugar metabolism
MNLREDRLLVIEKQLAAEGRVVSTELAEMLSVPVDMIRRDLRDLAARGICRRVYGGAVKPPVTAFRIPGTQLSALACRAAALISPHQVVFFDAGRTNLAIAHALDLELEATVVTSSPAIAAALIPHGNIELVVIGGRIDRAAGAAIGAMAVGAIRDWRFDLCLLGACAIAEEGISALHVEDAAMKRALIETSVDVVVAAIADKVGTRAPFHVAPLERLSRLIVEKGSPTAELERIRAAGVEVEEVGPDD